MPIAKRGLGSRPERTVKVETIGAIILAAGGASRLGQPKQLLIHCGETLVCRAASAALIGGCSPVIVVTGSEHERISSALANLPVHVAPNPKWELGIGSTIRLGLQHAKEIAESLAAVILMVCDQPHLTAEVVSELITAWTLSGRPIAASAYAGTLGVPALFGQSLFPALASLPNAYGAKELITTAAGNVARVEFPAGAIDIDTPLDQLLHL